MTRILSYCCRPLFLFAAIILTACTEVIDIELDSTYRRLVVFGTVTTDSLNHSVRLSTTSDYFSNQQAPAVSNALVELHAGEQVMRLEESDTAAGLYHSPVAFRGVPGTRYDLVISQVDIDGDGSPETYNATGTMPGMPQPDSIRLEYFQSPYFSGYGVMLFARDSPKREWYSYQIWKNRDLLTDELSDYMVQSDDFINGEYIFGYPVRFMLDEDPRSALHPGDTVTLEMGSIGKDYYDFISDAQLEIIGSIPLFSGPPANVRSNISNDGKGVFAVYSLKRVSAVVKP